MTEIINNEPLVAIAIPVYNTEKYFRDCLEHILAQTYQNWICYITDNASTDSSYQIAVEFVEKDNRFKVFRNEKTVTAFENWNITLGRMADVPAKYIKYECADDWMFPECIEKMVCLMETDENIGSCFGYRLIGKEVDCFGLDIYENQIFDGKEIILRSFKDSLYIYGGLGQALYRMKALKLIDENLQVINIENIHCDIELNDNVLQNWKVGFVYQVLMYYRKHDGQVWSYALKLNTDINGLERRYFINLKYFPELKEKYKSLRLDYALFLLKSKYRKNKDVLNWHYNHLIERPITEEEKKNAINRELNIEFGKIKKNLKGSLVMIIKLFKFKFYKL